MAWRRYPAYRDSGVAWLGEVPEGWDIQRLKFLCKERLKYGVNEATIESERSEPRYIRITDINPDGTLDDDTYKSLSAILANPYLLEDGDLLFARSGTVGLSFLYNPSWGRCCFASYLIRARLSHFVIPHFIRYFCDSDQYWRWISINQTQSTISNVNAERYGNMEIPIPPVAEQQVIVTFLSKETARIDALIGKKERLIALLQEKRTALISRAVTRGLDPSAPMKDSGIEWLGEAPAHWEQTRIKYFLSGIEQGWSPDCEQRLADPDEWGVLKVGCVNGGIFNENEHKALPRDLEPRTEYEVKPGDLLMSRANTIGLLGSCAIIEVVRPQLLLCDKLYRISPNPDMIWTKYLFYLFISDIARYQFERDATGTSNSMKNIVQGTIKDMVVHIPPQSEQIQIAGYLDQETSKLISMIATVQRSMLLLHEYRTAMISATVTGKIDVRGEAPA